MDSGATEKLHEIVAKYGPSIIKDQDRCEGLLRDYCTEYRRELSVLISSLRDHIPDLLVDQRSIPLPALRKTLVRQLEQNLAMDKAAAEWAVDAWASVLYPKPTATAPQIRTVYCETCGAMNNIPPTALPEYTNCTACGRILVQAGRHVAPPPVPQKPQSKTAEIVKILIPVFLLLGSLLYNVYVYFDNQQNVRVMENAIQQWKTEYEKERDRFRAGRPVNVTNIKLENQDQTGKPIGNTPTIFQSSSVRYVGYEITLENMMSGTTADGTLGVKYISPQTGLMLIQGSSTCYTFERPLRFTTRGIDAQGYGTATRSIYPPGTYRLEFYWNGQFISERPFTVNPSSTLDSFFN